jgi:hypothetical protein
LIAEKEEREAQDQRRPSYRNYGNGPPSSKTHNKENGHSHMGNSSGDLYLPPQPDCRKTTNAASEDGDVDRESEFV